MAKKIKTSGKSVSKTASKKHAKNKSAAPAMKALLVKSLPVSDERKTSVEEVVAAAPIASPAPIVVPPIPVIDERPFLERMIDGLTKKEVQGGRTLYLGEKDYVLEIVGGKLFNKGTLRDGWLVKLSSGDVGTISMKDDSRANLILGLNNEHSISAHSELEILDPAKPRERKAVVSTNEKGEAVTEKKVEEKKSKSLPYTFNGEQYTKSFLTRAIVAKFVAENPKTNVESLEKAFPAPFMGRFGLFKKVEEAKKISGAGLPRYFFKPEQLIKVGTEDIAICNQITQEKMDEIIKLAVSHGYVITEN